MDPGIIGKSFKHCCISNPLDGTEDDILWTYQDTADTTRDVADNDDEDNLYYNDEDLMSNTF